MIGREKKNRRLHTYSEKQQFSLFVETLKPNQKVNKRIECTVFSYIDVIFHPIALK